MIPNLDRRNFGIAALVALLVLLLTGCPISPSDGETLASFDVAVPESTMEGHPFTLTVTAVGSGGTRPFTDFSGSVTLEAAAGSVSPATVELSDGAGSVEAVVTGATGSVDLAVADDGVSGSGSVDVTLATTLPGDDADPAAGGVFEKPFEPRPDDYSAQHPDLGEVFVSFNTLLLTFTLDATVAEANAVLDDIDAEIVGGIPGVAGEAQGILFLRVATTGHSEMIALVERLEQEPVVDTVVQDALLEGTLLPQPNGGSPAGWTWDATPAGGNYGLELIRAPQMWNLNGAVRKAGGATATGVLDVGFADSHEDLTYDENQTPGTQDDHGTHVAGTVAADFDNGVGVDGVTPFADLVVRAPAFSGSGGTLDVRTSWGQQMSRGFFDLIRARPDLRVVNASLGYNWGPAGVDQDTNTSAQRLVERQGALFGLAEILLVLFNDDFGSIDDLPLFAVAAGNDSNDGFGTQDAQWASPFTYAGLTLDLSNVIVVESVANAPASAGGATRSSFSNISADISAPGSNILSTEPTDSYGFKSGTSMATPHVTGLISYLLSVDASLTHDEIRDLLAANAVPVAGGASDRIDAFATALDVDRVQGGDAVLRMLLDIDDGTPDGNQRILIPPTGADFTGEDADGDGGIGDGTVDMSDFRRFRDWLLQTEAPADLALDGAADHPKKDVNDDGRVQGAAAENLYPKGDFNGDGRLSRTATRFVPGVVNGDATDLQVLQQLFDDPNYTTGDLPALLDSGDLEIWPEACLSRSDVERVESSLELFGSAVQSRVHTGSAARQVYTAEVPVEASGYTARVRALDASGGVVFETERDFAFAPGSDGFWDPPCSSADLPPPPDGERGDSWGDPHQVSFDGLTYDFQAVGEFVFTESTTGDLTVQVRQQPWGGSNRVSVNTAVATSLGGTRAAFYTGQTPPLAIDGVPTGIADRSALDVGDGRIYRDGSAYTVVFAGGEQLRVEVNGRGFLNLRFRLTSGRGGAVAGLLGDADGARGNDLALRSGTVLAQPVPFTTLYGEYADSWRIGSAESLFDYASGEDTATFTDRGFPSGPARPSDLGETERADAEGTCEAAGISDPFLFDACVVDVGFTGIDAFAESSAAAIPPTEALDVSLPGLALIHGSDTTVATTYQSELERRGFAVDLVLVNSTESSNASILDDYDVLLVDTLSGSLDSWEGNEKVVSAIAQSGRPVLGIGEGGYAFLGRLQSPIGYPNGKRGPETDVTVTSPLHPSLAGPRGVAVAGDRVTIAGPEMTAVAIFLGDAPADLEIVGFEPASQGDPTHAPVLIDPSPRTALWGFHAAPSYTEDGWNSLANLVDYLDGLP